MPELLPAVDVAGGQAVRLVRGGRHRDRVRRPARRRARVAGRRGAVDPPGRPRRGVRTRLQRASCSPRWSARSTSRSSCPAGSATTRRCAARSPPAARRVNIGTAALEDPDWVRARDRRARRPGRRRPRRARHHAGRARLDPGRRRPVGGAGPARARTAAPATSSPTSPRTAPSPARTSTCCARSARAPTGRWSPAAASPRWPTCGRSPRWSRSGSRARSSARLCTRGRSRCRRPWQAVAAVTRNELGSDGVTGTAGGGYSRAVAAGDFVGVSGCTAVADGESRARGRRRAQAAAAIAIVARRWSAPASAGPTSCAPGCTSSTSSALRRVRPRARRGVRRCVRRPPRWSAWSP